MSNKTVLIIVMAVAVTSSVRDLQAQISMNNFKKELRKVDPTNKNSLVREHYRRIDQDRLNVMTPLTPIKIPQLRPQPGRDYTRIYLRNATSRRLKVSIHFYNNLSKKISGYEADFWSDNGYLTLNPGQTIHAANATSRNFYVSVYDNGRFWDGTNSFYHPIDRKNTPHKKYDFGSRHFTRYTVSLY